MAQIRKNDIVAHIDHKTVGIVLDDFSTETIDRGEVRTDSDGMVDRSKLIKLNFETYELVAFIFGYHVARSTTKLIDSIHRKLSKI